MYLSPTLASMLQDHASPLFLSLVVRKNCFFSFVFTLDLVQGFGVRSDGTQVNLHPRKGSYEKGSYELGRSRPGPGHVLVGPANSNSANYRRLVTWLFLSRLVTELHSYPRRHLGRWYSYDFGLSCLNTCRSRCERPRWRNQPSQQQQGITSTYPIHRNQ